MKHLVIGLAALAVAAPAIADEVWSTSLGNVVYEAEIGDTAVMSYPANEDGARGKAFIRGLAGNFEDRGRFTGYWSEPDGTGAEPCDVSIIDRDGEATDSWGRVEVIFVNRAYPSAFVALRGFCFDTPSHELVGQPLLGEAARDPYED